VIGMPLISELLFRSLAHGLLTQGARIQRNDTRIFVSWPNLGSALMYTGFIYMLAVFSGTHAVQAPLWQSALGLLSAAVFGLTLGMVRERSQSLFPTILFHILSAAAAILLVRFL